MLLQVLDDGRLTDGQGRTVDFRNTLIIMTSNLGAEFLLGKEEADLNDADKERVMEVVRAAFRPEFLNRIDEIIIFHRLMREHMALIVAIQMQYLSRLLADRKIELVLDDDATQWLANKGYDPAYGARPLKRVIQRYIQDPLAEELLSGGIMDGSRVHVVVKDDGLTFGIEE